jgi:uncharacterized protein (DUF488 family)
VGRDSIYTVGHSTRALDDFLSLLKREAVEQVADVRSFPASRRYPHFNKDALAASLEAAGIRYAHLPELGGRRAARKDSRNTAWRNTGFRGYADYMETAAFERGLDSLLEYAATGRTAIMCAEAVPWRCHRSMISDALLARGQSVIHILDGGTKPHTLTSFARVSDGRVSYADAAEPGLFDQG